MDDDSPHHAAPVQRVPAFVLAALLVPFLLAITGSHRAADPSAPASVAPATFAVQPVSRTSVIAAVPARRLPFTTCPTSTNCKYPTGNPLSYQFPLAGSVTTGSVVNWAYFNGTAQHRTLTAQVDGKTTSVSRKIGSGNGMLLPCDTSGARTSWPHCSIRVKTKYGPLPIAYLPTRPGAWKSRITTPHPYVISKPPNPFKITGYLQAFMSRTATGRLYSKGITEVKPGQAGRVAIKLHDYRPHHLVLYWSSDATGSRYHLVVNTAVQKIHARS